MAFILNIETATSACSVALFCSGKLVSHSETFSERTHGRNLLYQINHILTISGIKIQDLAAVAISQGPGSYTGLRIGTSIVKGLCYSHNISLIAIDTLSAMAYGLNKININQYAVCPMIDARRMEVYCSIFSYDNVILKPLQSVVLEENSFEAILSNTPIIFFGDGALKYQGLVSSSQALFVNNIFPSATHMGELSYQSYLKNLFVDISYFEPVYLKEFFSPISKISIHYDLK